MKRGFVLLLVSVLLPGAGLAAEQAHVFSAPIYVTVEVINGTSKVAVIDMRSLEVVRQITTQGAVPFWIAVQGNP